jgi:hypothetical protein
MVNLTGVHSHPNANLRKNKRVMNFFITLLPSWDLLTDRSLMQRLPSSITDWSPAD